MSTSILYLHGFNSSPQSDKVQKTQQYFLQHYPEINFICPQIVSTPKGAIVQLTEIIKSKPNERWFLIGSSLGGYFSTYLAETYHQNAVLINPAVKPYELLNDYIGEQLNPYTNERYQVTEAFINDLKVLEQNQLAEKNNYFVMLQTGDEVLDYQQAVEKYKNKQLVIQQGGDHSFVDYEKMLPKIAEFFQLD